jgi:hypothetical protein
LNTPLTSKFFYFKYRLLFGSVTPLTKILLSQISKKCQLQALGLRVVAIEIVGISAVGNWPDEEPAMLADSIPEQFSCAICQLLMYEPVTTNCGHNFCKGCLGKKKYFACFV